MCGVRDDVSFQVGSLPWAHYWLASSGCVWRCAQSVQGHQRCPAGLTLQQKEFMLMFEVSKKKERRKKNENSVTLAHGWFYSPLCLQYSDEHAVGSECRHSITSKMHLPRTNSQEYEGLD